MSLKVSGSLFMETTINTVNHTTRHRSDNRSPTITEGLKKPRQLQSTAPEHSAVNGNSFLWGLILKYHQL